MEDDVTSNGWNAEPTGETCYSSFDPLDEPELGFLVIDTIAEALDIEPADMNERLHEYVDVDALDKIFRNRPNGIAREGWEIRFRMNRCEVVIDGDGTIGVTKLEFRNRYE